MFCKEGIHWIYQKRDSRKSLYYRDKTALFLNFGTAKGTTEGQQKGQQRDTNKESKERKEKVDSVAATIILQNYLDIRKGKENGK